MKNYLESFREEWEQIATEVGEIIRTEEKSLGISTVNFQKTLALHSDLFYSVSRAWARVFYFVKRIKQFEKELSAEKGTEIRREPENFGINKVTEGAVAEVLLMDKSLKSLVQLKYEAEETFDICSALKEAFEHRRSMLNNITSLVGTGVFDGSEQSVDDYKSAVKRVRSKE